MNKTYKLICNGQTYNDISLEEGKQILFDKGHYSYAYIKDLVNKANVDYVPLDIKWVPGRFKNWLVNGVRMNYKTAIFALEFKGHTREEAEILLRAWKLCQEVEESTNTIRRVCDKMTEKFKQWLLSEKFGSALNAATSAK